MRIPIGEHFKLPLMGKDVFIRLTREVGLKYDSKEGFMVTPKTRLDILVPLLREALKEDVSFVLKCFTCGKTTPCETCVYNAICDRKSVSPACICDSCLAKKDAFALYAEKFMEVSG
jgi:hypothetical protein